MSDFTTHRLRELIALRYGDSPQKKAKFTVFFELRNCTGFAREIRSLDAFVMNLWPSEKFARYAFEIKCSRSDFLRELSIPHKRSWGMEVSNEFWFVCSPGVAKEEEIPEGCGLLVPTKSGKLIAKKRAQWRDARDFNMTEVAAIARQASVDFCGDLTWRYAERDLSREDLGELVYQTFDAEVERTIDARVSENVKERVDGELKAVRSALVAYSEALSDAGIEAPQWMSDPEKLMIEASHHSKKYRPWIASKWVEKNVKSIELATVERIHKSISDHAKNTNALAEQIQRLIA